MFILLKPIAVRMRWFLIGSLSLFVSCQSNQGFLKVLDNPLIVDSPLPIQLGLERTAIPMVDYVINPMRVDSITTDGPFECEIDNSNIIIFGRPKKSLYALTLWDEGIGESILLKRTKTSLYSFLYMGKANGVKVKGDFNDWNPNATILKKAGAVFTKYILLVPGNYQYQFVVDGKETVDPLNKDSASNESGGWNSVLNIPGIDQNKLPTIEITSITNSNVVIKSSISINKVYAFWQNTLLPEGSILVEEQNITISIPGNSSQIEQSEIRVWTENNEGASNEVIITMNFGEPLSSSPSSFQKDPV